MIELTGGEKSLAETAWVADFWSEDIYSCSLSAITVRSV